MNKKLLLKTLGNVTFVVFYIYLISELLLNSGKWFAGSNNIVGSFVILLLFSLSAAIVGGLTFMESIKLFLVNKRKESIKAAIYSIGWLGMYTVLGLLLLVITK